MIVIKLLHILRNHFPFNLIHILYIPLPPIHNYVSAQVIAGRTLHDFLCRYSVPAKTSLHLWQIFARRITTTQNQLLTQDYLLLHMYIRILLKILRIHMYLYIHTWGDICTYVEVYTQFARGINFLFGIIIFFFLQNNVRYLTLTSTLTN